MIYCHSQKQCEMLTSELDCEYYHADLTDRSEWVRVWLSCDEWIMMITVLRIRIDYLKIVFVLHVRMLYEMIDYVQKSEHAEQDEKTVNSMILMKNDETQQQSEYELLLNESVMIRFVLSDRCWQEMMSLYLNKKQIICRDKNMILCDQCEKEIVKWQRSQIKITSEWQKVWMMLNELTDECTACWITWDKKLIYLHDWQSCLMMTELSETACKKFQRLMIYKIDNHSCMWCRISQKICVTEKSVN